MISAEAILRNIAFFIKRSNRKIVVLSLITHGMVYATYAGSNPQTGPDDLRFSLGYFEYHSEGRH